jgi:flagellar biosynthesis/type III secretory pathway protein FliH
LEKGLEKGLEQGLEKGQQQEARVLVLRQLRKRLGGLDNASEARIEALPTERLEELGEALLDFSGPDDLAVWLQAHAE